MQLEHSAYNASSNADTYVGNTSRINQAPTKIRTVPAWYLLQLNKYSSVNICAANNAYSQPNIHRYIQTYIHTQGFQKQRVSELASHTVFFSCCAVGFCCRIRTLDKCRHQRGLDDDPKYDQLFWHLADADLYRKKTKKNKIKSWTVLNFNRKNEVDFERPQQRRGRAGRFARDPKLVPWNACYVGALECIRML